MAFTGFKHINIFIFFSCKFIRFRLIIFYINKFLFVIYKMLNIKSKFLIISLLSSFIICFRRETCRQVSNPSRKEDCEVYSNKTANAYCCMGYNIENSHDTSCFDIEGGFKSLNLKDKFIEMDTSTGTYLIETCYIKETVLRSLDITKVDNTTEYKPQNYTANDYFAVVNGNGIIKSGVSNYGSAGDISLPLCGNSINSPPQRVYDCEKFSTALTNCCRFNGYIGRASFNFCGSIDKSMVNNENKYVKYGFAALCTPSNLINPNLLIITVITWIVLNLI